MMPERKVSDGDRSKRPLSPCILVCTLDENNICCGCGRNLRQISEWALLSRDEQWAVVDELAARQTGI